MNQRIPYDVTVNLLDAARHFLSGYLLSVTFAIWTIHDDTHSYLANSNCHGYQMSGSRQATDQSTAGGRFYLNVQGPFSFLDQPLLA